MLGPLLFLIYINNLHNSILHSKVYHFADDTNLLHISSSYKKLQKNLNSDLKKLSNWLDANKISLNCTKTELIFFHKPLSIIPPNIKIKLNGKRLIATDHIKYLGVYLDKTLSGNAHYSDLSKKLHIANSMLARCRGFLPLKELKYLYHGIFSSHLNYACQIWGLSVNKYIDRIFKIQKNALRIITKSEFNAHTNPLVRELKILKLVDQITLLNCLFVHDYLNKRLPKSFDNTFVKLDEMNSINTRNSTLGCIYIPRVNPTSYGLNSIIRKSTVSWNYYTQKFKNVNLTNLSRNQLMNKIKNNMISTYTV